MGRYSETLRRRLSGHALSVVRRDDEQLRFAYPILFLRTRPSIEITSKPIEKIGRGVWWRV